MNSNEGRLQLNEHIDGSYLRSVDQKKYHHKKIFHINVVKWWLNHVKQTALEADHKGSNYGSTIKKSKIQDTKKRTS